MMPGFLLGIVCHEAAHAYMATRFGDSTAARQGRLSLNPAVHYDLVGTVIFPMIGAAIGGVMFGWAKPVPVDTRYFKNIKTGIFWVSFAGPLANLFLALISALIFAVIVVWVSPEFSLYEPFLMMARFGVTINIILAVFNLLPFPPLDGGKMAATFMDYEMARKFEGLQQYSMFFMIFLLMTGVFGYIVRPALNFGAIVMGLFIQILSFIG